MKTIKIVAVPALVFTLTMVALTINLEDPLKASYRETVEKMKKKESLESEVALLLKYPKLKDAKLLMIQSDHLKLQIYSKTSGFAPALTKNDENELRQMNSEWIHLRKRTKRMLNQLQTNENLVGAP